MVQEIHTNIYRIQVPLPNNPLKALNVYVIKGQKRNLVIDTGFNRIECQNALENGLKELEIDSERTDIFITHMHADHSGLIEKVATPNSKVYCSKTDGEVIALGRNRPFWNEMRDFAGLNGFPVDELEYSIEKHPGFRYCSSFNNFTYIKDQDIIEINGHSLCCVSTPGHTRGHMCLYEPQKKILFSGDHILGSITPNIALWSDKYSPLDMYFKSLDKVHKLDIQLTLPSHREPIEDCRKRIQELKAHHRHRLAEVKRIIGEMPQNACEVAAQMKWDLTYETWDEFPTPQKWFAQAEAIAHIRYLADLGEIQEKIINNTYMYSR